MTHSMTTECRLATYPRKLLLSAFALVACSRIAVVSASTQKVSSLSDELGPTEKVGATIASGRGVVHDQVKRPTATQKVSLLSDELGSTEEARAMIVSGPGVVHGLVKQHSMAQTTLTSSHDSERDEERVFFNNLADIARLYFQSDKGAVVNQLFRDIDINKFSYPFYSDEFYMICTTIKSAFRSHSQVNAMEVIFNGLLHLFEKNEYLETEFAINLIRRLKEYKKEGEVIPVMTKADYESKASSKKRYETAVKQATISNGQSAVAREIAPYFFARWGEKGHDYVCKLLLVDANSETFFEDSSFLVWMDFLTFQKDRFGIDPYESVLKKLQRDLNDDDAEIVKRLLTSKADAEPGTVAAHVMGALFNYWKSEQLDPVTVLEELVPSLEENLLDGPLRVWLRFADPQLGDGMFPTLLDSVLPPVKLPSNIETKLFSGVKTQLNGVDSDQPLPNNVKLQYENWQPYDQKHPPLGRYEPLPRDMTPLSNVHLPPPAVVTEPNGPQRDVVKEKKLVEILAASWWADNPTNSPVSYSEISDNWHDLQYKWMVDNPFVVLRAVNQPSFMSRYRLAPRWKDVDPSKSIRIEKIFEALCERWQRRAVSPEDMLDFLQIAELEGNHLLQSPHLWTWMTFMANSNQLSSMYNVLRVKLSDKELSMLIAESMDWKESFHQPWFRPLFDSWRKEKKSPRAICEMLELYPLTFNHLINPLMIILYHYVALAGDNRIDQILLLRAMVTEYIDIGDETIIEGYELTGGVLKQVYFELLAVPWLNKGITSNSILRENKELKASYNLMRTHPLMKGAFGKNKKVSVPKDFGL